MTIVTTKRTTLATNDDDDVKFSKIFVKIFTEFFHRIFSQTKRTTLATNDDDDRYERNERLATKRTTLATKRR